MAFKKVVVVGGGVLGSQIAYQVAYKGFDVTVWMRRCRNRAIRSWKHG